MGNATRGIRNKNPGNIRWGESWQGLIPASIRTDKSFCQFVDVKYGIRALLIILFNYRSKAGIPGCGGKGIDTIREIILRWAPPNENDTEAYITSVAKQCKKGPTEPLDLWNIEIARNLIKAIITHENGNNPYPDSQIDVGIKLAYESRV